jgi:hypothetical protein
MIEGGRVAMVVAVLAVASCRSGATVREPGSPRYAVPSRVGDLVVDAAVFARFADPVRRDAEAAAVVSLDRIRAVETDPVKAAMTGLSIPVIERVLAAHGVGLPPRRITSRDTRSRRG